MSLRRRTYLIEAAYWRDKEVRSVAESFYDSLIKFLETRLDDLVPRKDGGFSVHAMEFWKHPKARKFGVVFLPSDSGRLSGGIGSSGSNTVIIFPVMKEPGDKRFLNTRLRKDVVVHEMTHYLDPGYGKSGGAEVYNSKRASANDLSNLDDRKYYNSPGEWNAYWQEGAAAFERLLKAMRGNEKAMLMFLGDGSLTQARDRVDKIWDKGFLEYMSSATRRKFDKRFAQLWKEMKDKGLL